MPAPPRAVGTTPSSVPSPTSSPPAPILRAGVDVPLPKKLVHVEPVYPQLAVSARIAGIVELNIMIDERGLVRDARVTKSIPILDAAAVAAVKQWVFEPTLVGGKAVPVSMPVTATFTLRKNYESARSSASRSMVHSIPVALTLLNSLDAQHRMKLETALRSTALPMVEIVEADAAHFQNRADQRRNRVAAGNGVERAARRR